MKVLLICPGDRTEVQQLAALAPLANVPILGKSLIERWLEHLARLGAREVIVLASDRPEQVRAVTGNGKRWGLNVEVLPERFELSGKQAREKYGVRDGQSWMPAPHDVVLMDHLPNLPEHALFENYQSWQNALKALAQRLTAADRIGLRQIQPGVWAGMRTRVAPDVQFTAPCWLGENVSIGSGCVIGPHAFIEDRVFIESNAAIAESVVGPDSFVGELSELRHSFACGNFLLDLQNGSGTRVPDTFLLCGLGQRRISIHPVSWLGRLVALLVMILTLPLALLAIYHAKLRGQAAFRRRVAVRPRTSSLIGPDETATYWELTHATSWLKRWPQLWNVLCGHFAWVGNRPLGPGEVAMLSNDFERLWLAAPIGLVSLADAEACREIFDDEVRAHSSYYAVRADWRLNLAILLRVALAPLLRSHHFTHDELHVSLRASVLEERG